MVSVIFEGQKIRRKICHLNSRGSFWSLASSAEDIPNLGLTLKACNQNWEMEAKL